MVTKWDKSKKQSSFVCQMNEEIVNTIHNVSHEKDLPRLLCVLAKNGTCDWNTMCLSNFIRPRK